MVKPTGILGPFHAHVSEEGQVLGSFEHIPFSEEKVAVEQQIIEQFIGSMNNHLATSSEQFFLSNPQVNAEDDFDFTVFSPSGLAYLELMEIAPLRGPYAEAPASYKPYELAKAILSGILQKSIRYPKNPGRDIFLLLYLTHWSFALSKTTVACVRYWLKNQPTVFRAIFSYQPLDDKEGIPAWLFPFPPELLGSFDPEQVRDNVSLNLNPQNFQIVHGRG